MLNEIKAEIIALSSNLTFTRNLSLSFLVAIACLIGLAELQSQNTEIPEQASITNISRPSTAKFIVERK